METLWLSVSAGTGPEECAYAAMLTVQVLTEDLGDRYGGQITLRVVEPEPSLIAGNIRSALLELTGKDARAFADSWTGVIQWIWRSAYRPHHKRKNWFVSITSCPLPSRAGGFSLEDVHFETAKSHGPGGQYINKRETAVRATHIPTGKTVLSREERSQFVNKKLALARLAALLGKEQTNEKKRSQADRRHTHYDLERGSPIRVYDGAALSLVKTAGAGRTGGEERD